MEFNSLFGKETLIPFCLAECRERKRERVRAHFRHPSQSLTQRCNHKTKSQITSEREIFVFAVDHFRWILRLMRVCVCVARLTSNKYHYSFVRRSKKEKWLRWSMGSKNNWATANNACVMMHDNTQFNSEFCWFFSCVNFHGGDLMHTQIHWIKTRLTVGASLSPFLIFILSLFLGAKRFRSAVECRNFYLFSHQTLSYK